MRNTWRVAILTAVMMVGEIIAGLLFNSMALLADGWHMSTHALAIGLTGLAYLLSRRLANDERFTFGTWKIEILSSFTSALLLGVVALAMIVESAARLMHPVNISFDEALWVAVGGLVVNLISAWLLAGPSHHSHAHNHNHGHGHARAHDDLNLKSAYVHVVADAFTSVLAIVALIAGKFAGWSWLDPFMGVVGAVVILVWAYRLIAESSAVLLDREMDHPVVAEIRLAIESDGDAKLTDLHVWRVGRNHYACIVCLVADKPLLPDEYLGIMCHTSVTIEGEELEMWLPVMDGANKAMKNSAYSYKTKYGDKQVEAATTFDINKTMMRCLVKNLAMFGLGIYIYAGEDLPETEMLVETPKETKIVTLEIGDENWVKVLKYISSVKELGLEKIVENLSTKYTISTVIKKEIAKAIK